MEIDSYTMATRRLMKRVWHLLSLVYHELKKRQREMAKTTQKPSGVLAKERERENFKVFVISI